MALTPSEADLLARLEQNWTNRASKDGLLLGYREGSARIEHLGMAIPPEMRRFLVFINWCDTLVTAHTDRQQVRAYVLPGEDQGNEELQRIADNSNMDTLVQMFEDDTWTYGRSFLTVGANEDNSNLPLIRAESPREMSALVDLRTQRMLAAARFYGTDPTHALTPANATLYLPDSTVWLEKATTGNWVEVDRDEHRLGRVPVLMNLFRRRAGEWRGKAGIRIIIPLVDSVTRTMTNMQFAQEAAGVPRMYMTGVSQKDFIGEDGKPIPQFQAYFDAIHTLSDSGAKVGQLSAADLKNFETAVTVNGRLAGSLTKLPADYFGLTTTNPSGEGAIRANEARLIRSVETMNRNAGDVLGWAMALALRFSTGEWVEGNQVAVDWFDPATPTVAQRMDAVVKAKASGILSREGAWDELGWSQARKDRERGYFEAESQDALIEGLLRPTAGTVTDDAGISA